MRKISKLLFCTIALLNMLALVGMSYATGSAEQGGTKIIKFLNRYPEEPQNGYITKMVAAFETSHPGVKIDLLAAPYGTYPAVLKTHLSSDSPPDIYSTYPGEFTNSFVRQGLVLDITDQFNADTAWKNSQVAAIIGPYYYKDRLYGLPFRVDAKAFFYNKDMFDKYNLKAPQTWDDFMSLCTTLKQNGITPLAYGDQEGWESVHYIGTLNQKLVENSVRVKDLDPAQGVFTDPGYVDALKYYAALLPYMNPNPNGSAHEVARANFFNGKEAIMYLETIELPQVESGATFKYGIFGFPDIPSGKGDKGFVTGAPEGFVILKNTKYPKEALEFLKYITGPEVGKGLLKEVGWFNASKGVVDASYPDPGIREAYQMLTTAVGLTNWLDTDLNAELANKYITGAQRLNNGEVTPENLMKEIQDLAAEVRKNAS